MIGGAPIAGLCAVLSLVAFRTLKSICPKGFLTVSRAIICLENNFHVFHFPLCNDAEL
jgi:hypothetical protein